MRASFHSHSPPQSRSLPLPLAALSLAGLAAGGCIFNFFAEKHGSLYVPWFIHMGANLAINGIAMHLFGIL